MPTLGYVALGLAVLIVLYLYLVRIQVLHSYKHPLDIEKIQEILTEKNTNAPAMSALKEILRFNGGEDKLLRLFYGVDTRGVARYNTPRKFVALWESVDENFGVLSQQMQWQRVTEVPH